MVFGSLAQSFTKNRILATLDLATLLTTLDANAQGVRVQQRILAAGSAAQTACYVFRGKKSGPTILIIGGMHGYEPVGAAAAEQIASWSIDRGTLVIVAQANVLALQARNRRPAGKAQQSRIG
jgi:predicted deacylase